MRNNMYLAGFQKTQVRSGALGPSGRKPAHHPDHPIKIQSVQSVQSKSSQSNQFNCSHVRQTDIDHDIDRLVPTPETCMSYCTHPTT